MNIEKQRIAIAEACGWEPHYDGKEKWRSPEGTVCFTVPDYLNDLNAMHEAEKGLTITLPSAPHKDSERTRYVNMLEEMCGSKGMCLATATQRAEAFLRTKGLWEDSKQ